MTISLTHLFVSALADDPTDAANGLVVPTNWNAGHVISMAGGGNLIGRLTAGAGAVTEISFATFLQSANNLNDLASAITARSNLGLGSMAVQNASAVNITGGSITGLSSPVSPSDAATKSYVDATASGLSVRDSCAWATAAALPSNTYSNGSGGVGATLTATANGALSVDGSAAAVADRVLVKNEASPANNGLYVVTAAGGAGAPYVLTRAGDFNSSSNIFSGIFTFVEGGTVNAGAGYVLTTTGSITVGTTALNWTQFSGAGEITATSPLAKSGNTISLTTVPITLGGTGQTSALSGFNALSPLTTLGDLLFGGASGTGTRLAGNTTATRNFLRQTGTGSVSAAPVWDTIQASDLPGGFSGFAQPSVQIGLTANNGSGTAAAFANATPALSTAISPVWSAQHVFNGGSVPLIVQADGTGGQFVVRGNNNPNQVLLVGYATTNDYGFVQAELVGTAFKPLALNPFGGNVSVGGGAGILPDSLFTVNANAAATATPVAGTVVHVVGAPGSPVRIAIDSFAGAPSILFRRADGSIGSPSAVNINENIGQTVALGYGLTGYASAGRASFTFFAAETWTDTAQGTYWTLSTTTAGTIILSERIRAFASGGFSIGNTTDPGATNLSVTGTITASNFTGFANPTAVVGLTSVNGSATTAMRSDGAPALSQAIIPTWTNAHTWVNFTPIKWQNASGVFTSGTDGAEIFKDNANNFFVDNWDNGNTSFRGNGFVTYASITPTGSNFNTVNPITGTFGSSQSFYSFSAEIDQLDVGINTVTAFQFSHEFGGSTATGNRLGGEFIMLHNTPTSISNPAVRAYTSLVASVTSNQGDGGTSLSAAGSYWAFNPLAQANANAKFLVELAGMEINTNALAGSSMLDKFAISIVQFSSDAVAGSRNDAAIFMANAGTSPTTSVGWLYAMQLGNGVLGDSPPLQAGGSLIGLKGTQTFANLLTVDTSVAATITLTNGFDLRSISFSGLPFASPGFGVNSTGAITALSFKGTSYVVGSLGVSSVTAGQIINDGAYVTPQMYGAVGNGTTDDTTAMSNALNSGKAVRGGGPAYSYKITSAITVNTVGGSLSSYFDGGGCKILLSTTSSTITVNVSMPGQSSSPFSGAVGTQCVWRDVTLVPTVAAVGTLSGSQATVGALNLVCNVTGTGVLAGESNPSFYLENVQVAGDDCTTHYAYCGIMLKDMRNGSLVNCTVQGFRDGNFRTGQGFVWWSSVSGSAPVSVALLSCWAYFYGIGLDVRPFSGGGVGTSSDPEGLVFNGGGAIICDVGINLNTVDYTSAGAQITNAQFNCQLGGILSNDWWWVSVSNCDVIMANFGNLGTGKYTSVFGVSIGTDNSGHIPGNQGLNKVLGNVVQCNYATVSGCAATGVNLVNSGQSAGNSTDDCIGNSSRVAPGLTNTNFSGFGSTSAAIGVNRFLANN